MNIAMKKTPKIILISIGGIVGILVIAFGLFLLVHVQGKAESFEVNTPDAKHKILIATQGSSFKEDLLQSLIEEIQNDSLYVKVIDVGDLGNIQPSSWDGIILIHTVERFNMQKDVAQYLKVTPNLSNVILITTSGSGEWETDEFEVDVITSASKKIEIPNIISRIKEKFYFLND